MCREEQRSRCCGVLRVDRCRHPFMLQGWFLLPEIHQTPDRSLCYQCSGTKLLRASRQEVGSSHTRAGKGITGAVGTRAV